MDFFSSAIAAPEASDVVWFDQLKVTVESASDQVVLGEPMELIFQITNTGKVSLPVPETLDLPSLVVRVNVTDPSGRITFMRPATINPCPHLSLVQLPPGKSIKGTTTLFWGREGFAFETPGRHVVEVIVLWNVAGVPVAAAGERAIFVSYPVSQTDNKAAALLLDPEVGKAIATGRAWEFKGAVDRIRRVLTSARSHPAAKAIAKVAVLTEPKGRGPKATPSRARKRR
jgi:hypothetical protein